MVGVRGLEPPTSASQALRAPKLRYTPTTTTLCKRALSIPILTETTSRIPLLFPDNILSQILVVDFFCPEDFSAGGKKCCLHNRLGYLGL